MEVPKTIFPEEATLFQTWSVAAVGVTTGAGVGALLVLQAEASNAISRNTNSTGLAFILTLLVDESLSDWSKKDWMIGNEGFMAILRQSHQDQVGGSGKIIVRQKNVAHGDLMKFQNSASYLFINGEQYF